MPSTRLWSAYPLDYRSAEMKQITRWIGTNSSGSLTGLPGSGKSNLLGYLCHRSDALAHYLPQLKGKLALIPVDLNNLPANNLSTFYRAVLRAFYEASDQLKPPLGDMAVSVYMEHQASRDPFLSQSGLRQLLREFQDSDMRVVLVFDRFDKFCRSASPLMTDTLRGLRDSFKATLSYIVGMRQELIYLPEPQALGELYELLDIHVCWLGPLREEDSRHLIASVTAGAAPPSEPEIAALLRLSGGHPALLKAACTWWLSTADHGGNWAESLLADTAAGHRLTEIWDALSQEEQKTVSDIRLLTPPDGPKSSPSLLQEHRQILDRLESKGVGRWQSRERHSGWELNSLLLGAFVDQVGGRSRGRLWFDQDSRLAFQGGSPLQKLAPLENALLEFLITHPYSRHTYTELIEAAWPEEVHKEGVATEALYQVVRGLRRHIEPEPSKPHYVVNWRGKPEGGYQCFPEGRPA